VVQRSLSDFYVEYDLNAHVERPETRVLMLSTLHAAIQDVFNEHGVQIMSPHYEMDPAEAVVVPKARWYEPPARQDGPPKRESRAAGDPSGG
jgi:small-conductance mechanosensitive channel